MLSFISMISTACSGVFERGEDVPQQIVGERPGRLDALLLVGDRGGLDRADPDRQVAVALDLASSTIGWLLGSSTRTPTTLSSRTAASIAGRLQNTHGSSVSSTPFCTLHARRRAC